MSGPLVVDDELVRKLLLVVGFLSLAGSAAVAHANPATGYEISLYTMTPPRVWAGLLVAMSVALAVAFVSTAPDRGSRPFALVLGGLATAVFVGLPIVRGYRFLGHHDALSHLGWARAIREGTMAPFDLYYPGIHTMAVFLNSTLEIPLSQSMLLVVFLSMLVFFAFVPLIVGAIVSDRRGSVIGAFAAFLLLPITTISMFPTAHAMTQAVLFSSVFVYLLVKYVRPGRKPASASAVGVAFALVSVATVVYHPQLVAHLIVALVGICLIQSLARRVASEGRMAGQPTLYGHTLFLIGLFLLWSSNHDFFSGTIEHFVGSAIEFLLEGRGGAGDAIATQGASIASVGGSLLEIFFKLFTAQLAFVVLAGALALAVLFGRNSRWIDRVRAETTYLFVALAGLGPLFVIYFLAPGSKMHFRVFGLMMLFVTILGAVAIHGLTARFWDGRADSGLVAAGRPLVAVAFAFLLILSLAAVFPSPYTYNASPHVSEAQMSGYETAFASQDDDLRFVGLRDGPNRHDDAVNGNAERMTYHPNLPESSFDEPLADRYDEDRYLAVTRADYEREVVAYDELRYTEGELDSIATQPRVNRVQSNGEFTLYYVDAETTE